MASKANFYQILQMDKPGTPPLFDPNTKKPLLFTDPEEAALTAKRYSIAFQTKYCVKPLLDNNWKEREELRFAKGEYRYLPWALTQESWWQSTAAYVIWKDQFPHASLEKPGWIAFTKSPEDGQKDKQTLLRPGAYLNRYFAQIMNDFGVSESVWVREFMKMYGPIDVHFADTEKDITQVYAHGPKTCMNDKYWPLNTHPATIYAAGDLAIAYLGDIEGKVSARALVWPKKKLHSRVYGDIARLTQGLERLGYKWGAPIGARLKRIQLQDPVFKNGRIPIGCFLAPYLDRLNQQGGGHLSVIDKGDHLEITQNETPGSHHAGSAEGMTGQYVPREDEYPTFQCDSCGKAVKDIERVITNIDADGDAASECWCYLCIDDKTYRCGWSGAFVRLTVPHVTVNGNSIWATYYADMYAHRCEGNGQLYTEREMCELYYPDGTKKYVSKEYIAQSVGRTFISKLTNRHFPNSEYTTIMLQHGYPYPCAKYELKRHAFTCVHCNKNAGIAYRNQPFGDDRLYCDLCIVQNNHKQKRP